ncbi:MAG TPA: hypothetical protein VF614_06280 [Chthoniobacteraceae bacterium]|jgi:hypothetical protein
MTLLRLFFFFFLAVLRDVAHAAPEEIAVVPTTTLEAIPGKLCLWADEFTNKPVTVRRGTVLKFACLLANGTRDDLIFRWTDAPLEARTWELRRGKAMFRSGVPSARSGAGHAPNYKILFAGPGARHMDSGNTLSIPFTAKVPDWIGSGRLEVQFDDGLRHNDKTRGDVLSHLLDPNHRKGMTPTWFAHFRYARLQRPTPVNQA